MLFASANTCSACFGSYFANDKYLDKLRDVGRILSPWENGLANNIGFCHEAGRMVTARNGRLAEDISLTDLVAVPKGHIRDGTEVLALHFRDALRRRGWSC